MDEIEKLRARVAELEAPDPGWMAELVQERIDELGAEAEAFDTDCIRAATRLAEALDLDAPGSDPWSAHDLYDAAVEALGEMGARVLEQMEHRDAQQARAEKAEREFDGLKWAAEEARRAHGEMRKERDEAQDRCSGAVDRAEGAELDAQVARREAEKAERERDEARAACELALPVCVWLRSNVAGISMTHQKERINPAIAALEKVMGETG